MRKLRGGGRTGCCGAIEQRDGDRYESERGARRGRHNNASIVTAYDAARQAAIGGALKQAHEYALAYAKAVGLTLGPVVSVSDAQNSAFQGPGLFFGPFGPNQFCGTLRQPIFKKGKNGRRKLWAPRRCTAASCPGLPPSPSP